MKSVIKLIITSYIRVAIVGSKLDHIISAIIVVITSDNKVVVIKGESNLLINDCIVINKGIKKTTTNFVYIVENQIML
jgi:hypothetical protein